jgi:hypothetical protein
MSRLEAPFDSAALIMGAGVLWAWGLARRLPNCTVCS